MAKNALPKGHPFLEDTDGVDPVTLAQRAIEFRRGEFGGFRMLEGDGDDEDDAGDDPDGDDEDENAADPESTIKVGERTFKVGDLQKIMAREKRQGKRSGASELVKDLGFDNVEALKTALAGVKPPAKGSEDDDEATKQAAAREAAAAKRESEAAAKARRADLRGALREHGVGRDDLDDVFALLDRKVPGDYDEDDVEDAVEELKKRRPAFFGEDEDTDERPPARVTLPAGGPRKKAQAKTAFGAGGLERARRKGWIKD